MLLTPHIVRTQELSESDLRPIYIGSLQNLSVGGPPPLIAEPAPVLAPSAPAPQPGNAPQPPATIIGPNGQPLIVPPGSSPVPGTIAPTPQGTPPNAAPVPAAPTDNPNAPAPAAPPVIQLTPQTAAPAAEPVVTSPGVGSAQVLISPPGTGFRVGGGPYTVPLSVTNASGLSTVTLTLVYDSTKLRVRSVQEGSFMRAGGVDVAFTQQVNPGRVDITLVRSGRCDRSVRDRASSGGAFRCDCPGGRDA